MDIDQTHRQFDNIVVNSNDIHNIVLSYLVHNCYKDTVKSYLASSGLELPPKVFEEMEKRKAIFCCVMGGSPLKAIELTQQLTPDLLEKNKELHFEVLCLNFVELVRSRKCEEAVEYAQTKLGIFGQTDKKYLDKLQDLMPLVAYVEPETSPVFHFLGNDYKEKIADHLNIAILENANMPSRSALERLTQQLTVVRKYCGEVGKDEIHPFSLKDFLKS